jgi:peptide/nickel transport system permease protein
VTTVSSLGRRRLIRRNRLGTVAVRLGPRRTLIAGASILGLIVLACVVGPLVLSSSAQAINATPEQAPSAAHPFGTDVIGRDILARVLIAGRVDIALAVIIVVLAVLIGATVGTVAGSTRLGWLDALLMRIVDAVLAFPFLILELALVTILGPTRSAGPLPAGAPAAIGGIVLVDWAVYARLARADVLKLRDQDFVVAAQLLGYSRWQVLRRHLLPNIRGTLLAYAASDLILAMVSAASLSYVGLGVQQPTPEWGSLIFSGSAVLGSAWWIAVIPGICLVVTGFSFALIADGYAEMGATR